MRQGRYGVGGKEIGLGFNMVSIFYFVMLAFFLVHELDAVKRHEWRVLPLISLLPETIGEQVFIWIHVLLFFGLFYLGAFDPNTAAAKGLSTFAIIHIGLHWFFRNHPKYEFNNISSWMLIVTAGLFGAAHLFVGW